jgi:preprotein translocase subunit SecA
VAAGDIQDAPPSLTKERPEIRAKGLDQPKRADRLQFSAPSVDGEGGVVQGEFAGDAADAVEDTSDGLTRAERRRAAKGGRRRKK